MLRATLSFCAVNIVSFGAPTLPLFETATSLDPVTSIHTRTRNQGLIRLN